MKKLKSALDSFIGKVIDFLLGGSGSLDRLTRVIVGGEYNQYE